MNTNTTKQMTLEQVRDLLLLWHEEHPSGSPSHSDFHKSMADTITAHLSDKNKKTANDELQDRMQAVTDAGRKNLRAIIDAYEDATGDRLVDGDGEDYRIAGAIFDAVSSITDKTMRIPPKVMDSNLSLIIYAGDSRGPEYLSFTQEEAAAWNRCIDEIIRLNPQI